MKYSGKTVRRGSLLALAAAIVGAGLLFVSPHKAFAASSVGGCGRLNPNDSITSDDGHYITIMQGDGNLVTYVVNGRALWASGTGGHNGAWASMQCDGNLVIVDTNGRPLWATGTNGHDGAYLAQQTDGNLVVVKGSAWWASGAVNSRLNGGEILKANQFIQSPDRRYRMVMQGDGNLVVYGPSGATWASNHTNRQSGSTLEMQGDGNLVVYGPGHIALWASGRFGSYPSLVGQNDGNFVVYGANNAKIWSIWDGGSVGGTIPQLAQQILDEWHAGKITIYDYSENKSRDSADRSLASQQLADLAAGKQARLSTRCTYASQLPSAITPDAAILQFLADYGNQSHYTLNVLFGQCHSGPGSYHHKGKAVDFACGANLAIGDNVGSKYGVKRNFETCSANGHWHYSVGGY
ncbi:MAG TPA: hypothetical protein VLE73_03985 [Candidatus Saccharimonadales bacterium]|nr:hypothetical protein [Candidatus Saccharimonadales bacterium]